MTTDSKPDLRTRVRENLQNAFDNDYDMSELAPHDITMDLLRYAEDVENEATTNVEGFVKEWLDEKYGQGLRKRVRDNLDKSGEADYDMTGMSPEEVALDLMNFVEDVENNAPGKVIEYVKEWFKDKEKTS